MRLPFLLELVRDVSLPHWREHRLRTALTVLGVALGVACVVGMADVGSSVLASFHEMMATAGGDGDLEVTSPTGGVPEAMIDQATGVAGIKAAADLVEGSLPLADDPSETLYLLGVDFLGSPVWEHQFPRQALHVADEIVFLSHADSAVIPQAFATRRGWKTDDPVAVVGPRGPATLQLRGMLDDVQAARLFGGALVVMDLPAAQRLLERDGLVDRIIVTVTGDDLAGPRAALQAALGPTVEVNPPESRGQQAERLLFTLRVMLASMSACAVIVGTLIVFHTVSVSVEQRRRLFALLHVAGVSPRRLARLCLFEVLLLAVGGVMIGLVGGHLLGQASAQIVGSAVSDLWQGIDVHDATHSFRGVLMGVAAALVTALGAGTVAVRATFAQTTVEALRPAGVETATSAVRWTALVGPLLIIGGSWLSTLAPPGLSLEAMVALIVAYCSAVYLGGTLLATPLVSLAGTWLRRLGPKMP